MSHALVRAIFLRHCDYSILSEAGQRPRFHHSEQIIHRIETPPLASSENSRRAFEAHINSRVGRARRRRDINVLSVKDAFL